MEPAGDCCSWLGDVAGTLPGWIKITCQHYRTRLIEFQSRAAYGSHWLKVHDSLYQYQLHFSG